MKLIPYFLDKDQTLRSVASKGLETASVLPEEAVPAVNDALQDSVIEVRSRMCEFLGRCSPPAGQKMTNLPKCLTDIDAGVRASAAYAVGKLQLKAHLPTLVRLLEDPVELVAPMALVGLEQMGDGRPFVIEAIINARDQGRVDSESAEIVLRVLINRK